MVEEQKSKEEKKNIGRPKGAKSQLGIPIKDIDEAVQLVKLVFDKQGSKNITFEDLAKSMSIQTGALVRISNSFKEYGLLEQTEIGWKVTDLGRRAVSNDKAALKEAFEKNDIFKELSGLFWDKDISENIVFDYLKKKYKKGENVKIITDRFLKGREYIKSIEGENIFIPPQEGARADTSKIIKLIKLKYALNPPKEEEIDNLVEDIIKELRESNIISIKVLTESIDKNKTKEKRAVLSVLIDNIIGILSEDYPELKM